MLGNLVYLEWFSILFYPLSFESTWIIEKPQYRFLSIIDKLKFNLDWIFAQFIAMHDMQFESTFFRSKQVMIHTIDPILHRNNFGLKL